MSITRTQLVKIEKGTTRRITKRGLKHKLALEATNK